MSITKYIQTAISHTVRNVASFFLAPAQVREEEPRRRRRYDPRQHTNFYVVSTALIQHLLEDSASKTARQFASATGYAESTIRATCKLLAADGVLVRTQEFPASYQLASEQVGRETIADFRGML